MVSYLKFHLILFSVLASWTRAEAAPIPKLSDWITEQKAKPSAGGRPLPVLWKLALVDGASAVPSPLDETPLKGLSTVEFSRASDLAASLSLNPKAKTGNLAQVAQAMAALGRADAALVMPRTGWETAPWTLVHQGKSTSCSLKPGPQAAPASKGESFLARLSSCLGYSAVILDVKGEHALAVSLQGSLIKGLQGLLIKDSSQRRILTGEVQGEGLMKIVDFEGPFVVVRRLVDSPVPLEAGAKIQFEQIKLPQ